MDALIAKADSIKPLKNRTKSSHLTPQSGPSKPKKADQTLNSIAKHTSLPKSLQDHHARPESVPSYNHIANKRLRTHLDRQALHGARSKALLEDAEMLLMDDAGGMQAESEMDRTWRAGQTDIMQSAGHEAAKGRREYKLDGGPYRSRYTRNGRHMAIVGRSGHVSTFDWQTGTMHAELQLQETCRDITYVFSILFEGECL
jgi:U3 small nucleolar RNA-associated protein 7